MKTKLLLLLFLFAFKVPAFAQQKVTKYVTMTAVKNLSDNLKVRLDLGKTDSAFSFKDAQIKIQLQKVINVKTDTELLNYMSSINWTFIHYGQGFYIFKRDFDLSELSTTSNH